MLHVDPVAFSLHAVPHDPPDSTCCLAWLSFPDGLWGRCAYRLAKTAFVLCISSPRTLYYKLH